MYQFIIIIIIIGFFRFYCRLFSATQKNHIRRFAAESFSFLTRKVNLFSLEIFKQSFEFCAVLQGRSGIID